MSRHLRQLRMRMGLSEEAMYLWGGWFFLLGQGLWILVWIGIDCSENMVLSEKLAFWGTDWAYGRLVGVSFRREDGRDEGGTKGEAVAVCLIGIRANSSWCEVDGIAIMVSVWYVFSEKLAFYVLACRMGEIGVLRAGWDGRSEWTGRGGVKLRELWYRAPDQEHHHCILRCCGW